MTKSADRTGPPADRAAADTPGLDAAKTATLTDATVVVIGGSSGMGLGVARSAAAQGASVIVTSRSPDRLAAARALVTDDLGPAAGISSIGRVDARACDLTSQESIRGLFEGVERLDHLVITATPSAPSLPFVDAEVPAARAFVDGKLWGVWAAARDAALRMPDGSQGAPPGSITFTTGGMAVRPSPGRVAVTVAFAAVEALARALAVELAPRRVNVIRPGMIDSPMWNGVPDQDREKIFADFSKTAPVHRVGRPADIGEAATFLMTATFITGAIVDVDGGSLLS